MKSVGQGRGGFWTRRLALGLGILLLSIGDGSRAGDILRGGASSSGSRKNSDSQTSTSAEAANITKANAQDRLARTTQAISAVRALQKSAAAATAVVPDGLKPGGLQILTGAGARWEGASLPSQSGGTVTIKQNKQQAILHWQTFNVGKNTTLEFDQSAGGSDVGKWIAFNKVFDPTGVPSKILGSIKAQGQVYILNQNGIIFGRGSQVNVHTLVASSLPINDNLVSRGLLDNPDLQPLFTSFAVPKGTTMDAFTPPTPLTANGKIGDVVVESGAQLTAPTNAAHVGGRIALVGPNVNNAGIISTPDGQTIMAAGLEVNFFAHSSDDASLRGLDVYVGRVGDYAGTVINAGLIDVPRASALLTGKMVSQMAVIDASTSVSLNGRVDLLANYDAISNSAYDATKPANGGPFFYKSTGAVTLGPGSVTRILPELASTETAVGTELALRSQINLQGKTINLGAKAMVLAPNANVTAKAGLWQFAAGAPQPQFVFSDGQIYLDSDSLIDVAGTAGATAAISDYILSVQLRGSELADSPLQRDGLLRSLDLFVDARKSGIYNGRYWVGTPLGDATGFLGLIQRTVGELTVAGGSVNLQAGGSVVLQHGSVVDVSGGYTKITGGLVKTTKVLYRGRLIDISDATPDTLYDGIYSGMSAKTHAKWGITKTFSNPLSPTGSHFEPDYIQGAPGGSISISAPSMALDGKLTGMTVPGPRQTRSDSRTSDMPTPSSLSLAFVGQFSTAPYEAASLTPPKVLFQDGVKQVAADAFAVDASGNPTALREDRRDLVVLSPDLLGSDGFGKLSVQNDDGDVVVPANVELKTAPGGSIALTGANISIAGKVTAPAGTLSFKTYNISPTTLALLQRDANWVAPAANLGRGVFSLGSKAVLSAAGTVVDDRVTSRTPANEPIQVDGGSIDIATYDADLAQGSVIDVSGGVVVDAKSKKTYGVGGSIAIKTGQDLNVSSVVGGKLALGATLKGYSRTTGGSLTLQATTIQVGGASTHPGTLLLTPDFFNQGGFSKFTLSGLGEATGVIGQYMPALVIAPGTVIEPVAQAAVEVPYASGGRGLMLKPVDLPAESRAPVSLSFNALGAKNAGGNSSGFLARGDLIVGEGSVIRTDPQASVSFSGNTVAILGSVYAPAGSISVSGGNDSTSLFPDNPDSALHALTTVYIGSHSVLSAAGVVKYTPDAYGRRTGTVLPGGSITLSGNVAAAAGAVLDVSGASGILDLALPTADAAVTSVIPASSGVTGPLASLRTVPTRVDSNGGSITLTGGQMLNVDATLLGRAGGPTALGGSLSVSSGRFYPVGVIPTSPIDPSLYVTQGGLSIQKALPDNAGAIGQAMRDRSGAEQLGQGNFAVSSFANGGFDSLALNGVVQFVGPVAIDARQTLKVATGGAIYADSDVSLSAPYVALGFAFPSQPVLAANLTNPFGAPVSPSYGPGRLTVTAKLIDVGSLSLQNIGSAALIADNGDIRGYGVLDIAGDLLLRAGQIYPTTAGYFSINAFDHGATPGSVTIEASGARPLPLSAGGRLSIYASKIAQGGVLRAPFGSINIGWDGTGSAPTDLLGSTLPFPVTQQVTLAQGSITSVSGVDPATGLGILVPYGTASADGSAWIDPYGVDITGSGIVGKNISIAGVNISADTGSVIDLRGGGDLFATRFQTGNGGTVDILGTPSASWDASVTYSAGTLVSYKGATWSARQGSTGKTPSINEYWTQVPQAFAVVPGYSADYAPFGGSGSGLSVGDRVYLGASSGLAAGFYTLLPAQYAVLPGAVLVTPKAGAANGSLAMEDGSSIVSGYRFNDLNGSRKVPALATNFEVAPAAVVAERATYIGLTANSFLREGALALDLNVPRLPVDAGHLILQATQSMVLQGIVQAQGAIGGRGGLVDIASTSDIFIGGAGSSGGSGVLTLDASRLSSFGAESLLIGGIRTIGSNGTTVAVRTGKITVDNAGSPLVAPDLILVAKQNLTLAPGAVVTGAGSLLGGAENLQIGDSTVAGSGDGVLLRVSSDATGSIQRSGVSVSTVPSMVIGAGASISGGSLTLDSTYATSLDPTANLNAAAIYLNSGQISLALDNPGTLQPTVGLVLAGNALHDLQAAQILSLLSYSSIDIYGTGQFTSAGSLALHAAEIRGFNNGGGLVQFNAQSISLDNSAGQSSVGAIGGLAGTLEFNAGTIKLGAGQLNVDQFANLNLNASNGLFLSGAGGLATQGALTISSPFLTAAAQASQTLKAGGALLVQGNGSATAVTGGLGASLTLQGLSVATTSDIILPSGQLTLHATGGDVTVGSRLDVAGTSQTFYDLIKYTDGGKITLTADQGSVNVLAGSVLNVSAQLGAGNAGSLVVGAPTGNFSMAGTLLGHGGVGGSNGTFGLDVGSLSDFAGLNTVLNVGGFTESRSMRVRTGNVLVDGLAKSHIFNLSADQGSISVLGTIDASGATGGTINLSANGSVSLLAGSLLTVAAQDFSDAGKGGEVSIEAGAERNGVKGTGSVDIQAGSSIDLSVASKIAGDANTPGTSAFNGQFSGKLHIRAPQNAAMTDLLVNPINGTIVDASSIVVEGYQLFDLTPVGGVISGAGSTTQASGGLINDASVNVQGSVLANGNIFGAQSDTIKDRLFTGANASLKNLAVVSPGAEIINRASSASPVSLSLNTSGASSIVVPATGGTIVFPQGTQGNNQITSSVAAIITSASGVVTSLAANTPTTLAAGSSVTLAAAGTVSFAAGGTGGPIALQLTPGTSFTTAASNTVGTVNTPGASVTLNTPGTSKINLTAGTSVVFTVGTPGTRRITSTVAGTITTASGAVIALAANTATAIAAGSTVTLNSAGSLAYANTGAGTGTPSVTLLAGSFTTGGAVGIASASGNLTLGTTTSTNTSDWDLSTYRFGPQAAPGVLTLRAAGNLVFYNALSDGFTSSAYTAGLLTQNALLPVNAQSYSYRLVAGADLGAADFGQVLSASLLGSSAGSLQLGKNNGSNVSATSGANASTSQALTNRFQVIRTGSGDIAIHTGRSVQLLNAFATIYTAGTQVADATIGGSFDVPVIDPTSATGVLGANQQVVPYPAQYSMAGGNVSIFAQENIEHLTRNSSGQLIADSQREMPTNWLYRRGYVDATTGEFGTAAYGGDVTSTTWWIDFSNFFQGVGALGGGDVTMVAGKNISNVDAVVPTNARMTKDASTLVELGGGDLLVRAGNNIDAGVYYVERGQGTLSAGKDIVTNYTRSPSLTNVSVANALDSTTWLPTTLFLGKGGFDVSAQGNVLLGPVVNPFLLPGSINNGFRYKTYFSTYAADSYVNVSSLGGLVTLREATTLPNGAANPVLTPILQAWYSKMLAGFNTVGNASINQPWLRLDESSVAPFGSFFSLMAPTLRATAFSGDINLVGNITLSPAANGTADLLAAGAINGLQPTGVVTPNGVKTVSWAASRINVSDANPAAIPSTANPLGYQGLATTVSQASQTSLTFLLAYDRLFAESGATVGVVSQTKQALHDSSLLHLADLDPVRLYASGGNISGLTLFSPKIAQIFAGKDISDIALYIQNVKESDVSIVASGRDIVAYNANSPLRVQATALGNTTNVNNGNLAGDIQISGPGTLEVLAGRNLDLGTGPNNANGTGSGIVSVGNARNSSLSSTGANLIVAAGIGPSFGLEDSSLDFEAFSSLYGAAGNSYLAELGAGTSLDSLTPEESDALALRIFFLALRDAGRAHSLGTATDYEAGDAAIAALFGKGSYKGDILARSRDIRTKNGGDISILAPGGKVTLATAADGTRLAPPGIITESGGNISIFAKSDVEIGSGRIFTLRGGSEIIWSSEGDIAAGSSAKTVKSAAPTRVLIDPQSANVETDLAGLATGGGIGVLATVAGVPPGDVDLIAPLGTVDAGDAGIRATGKVNIAATTVLNADNISAGQGTTGVPTVAPPAAPNIQGLTAASNTAGAASNAANDVARQSRNQNPDEEAPSVITVEVLGYGGDDSSAAN